MNNVLLCVELKAFSWPLKSVSMSFCFAWDVFFSITGCRVFWRDGQVLSSRRWKDKLNKQLLHKHYAPPLQRDRIFYWVGMFFPQKDNNNQKKHCTYKCFLFETIKANTMDLHCNAAAIFHLVEINCLCRKAVDDTGYHYGKPCL